MSPRAFPAVVLAAALVPAAALLLSPASARSDDPASAPAAAEAASAGPRICLLPLGKHDARLLGKAAAGIKAYYRFPVKVMDKLPMPTSAYYPARKRHRADKLLDYLDETVVPSSGCAIVIGFTSQDISTTKGSSRDWGIFGLGRISGTSAVVSTFRLGRKTADRKLVTARTIKVVNHELGHVLGLPHCPTPACMMNDAEGSIKTVDREQGNLCDSCRKTVQSLFHVVIPEGKPDWDTLLQ
jgi:archaemetzincin